MENKQINEILGKQLELLAEASKKASNASSLAELSHAMTEVAASFRGTLTC